MIRACGLAVLAAVFVMLLRELRDGAYRLIEISAAIIFFLAAVTSIAPEIAKISELLEGSSLSGYAAFIIRALGVAALCEVTGDICRACGSETAARGVEIFGRAEMALLSLPLLTELLNTAVSFLK